jgi:ABC-type multidrug transport system ATPase subunit
MIYSLLKVTGFIIHRYCLIGPSGSGKTTLLSCILDMKAFNSGSIRVLGSENVSEVSHRVGFMPQNIELVPKLTVLENLCFFGNIHQIEKTKLKNQIKMLSSLLEINFQASQVTELSGGQKRRVALAIALIHEPQLLILDEPTVGLDVILREKIWNFLQTLTEKRQISVLVTTHYIYEAQFAHRVGFIRKGAILAENSSSKIIESLQVENLDEAFVEMCRKDEKNSNSNLILEKVTENYQKMDFSDSPKPNVFAFQTLSALFLKEFLRVIRTPS